ncbi:MAG: hypothetical protein IIC79_02280 [Chloroflexi bacterium]|nr:hypothetical protein [Chloroflexota bacterium]
MIKTKFRISRQEMGTVIVFLGVFVWVPYFFLLFSGKEAPIILFLILHLLGIFGGSKLRGKPAKEAMLFGKRRRKISRIMIYVGVLAWLPYYYIEGVIGQDVAITPFLFVHLAGIIGGVLVRGSIWLSQIIQRRANLEID